MNPRARQEHILTEPVADELVVYDEVRHRAHRLNRSAALVWRHCDGQRSPAELATLLAQQLGEAAGEDLVWLALDRLEAANLLQEPLQRSTEQRRLSRRQTLLRVSLAG